MSAESHPSLRVAFRTDASLQIGTGHVMRCLTLADALVEHGAECTFVSREHHGNLNDLVAARGHQVLALPAAASFVSYQKDEAPPHGHWLGTGWSQDVQQTLQALGEITWDWLVVDHYALDARWETALRPACRKLMVIDDLADRRHDCDLLLDQNMGRTRAHYLELIPLDCVLLAGPDYALLRPEFLELRDESLARRGEGRLDHLMITLGGVDKDNVTGKVLDALAACSDCLPTTLQISVIMGPYAPWRKQVQEQAPQMPWPTMISVGVADMARRMTDADLVIGAAGSTSWERCCLGVPSLQIVLAENQTAIAQSLVDAQAALTAPADALVATMLNLFADQNLQKRMPRLSCAASEVTDGRGTHRVMEKILGGLH